MGGQGRQRLQVRIPCFGARLVLSLRQAVCVGRSGVYEFKGSKEGGCAHLVMPLDTEAVSATPYW